MPETNTHETKIKVLKSPSTGVPADTNAALVLGVSCSQGCDLRGKTIKVVDKDRGLVVETALSQLKEKTNETDELRVRAPAKLGEFILDVTFPAQVAGDVQHAESSARLNLVVKPHSTSMAVWGFPFPVITRDKFKVKVGVSCSGNCKLTGRRVQVCDEKGKKMGSGKLGEDPWPQTSGLYWAEVTLKAPASDGVRTWSAEFPNPRMKLPHEGSSSSFAFRIAKPPQFTVTVEVVDKASRAPLKNARVLLFPYEGSSDEKGIARLRVARGKYNVEVGADKFVPFQTSIEVSGDTTLKAELSPARGFY